MASPVIADVVPSLAREKKFAPSRGGSHKPLSLLFLLAICLLCLVGIARTFQKPPAPDSLRVVAAGKDIAPGCRIGFTNLHYLNIPRQYWSPSMVTSYPDVAGRVAAAYIACGEPILKSALLPGHSGLSPQINVNERAITLRLSDDALVDHALSPGDRVDVISTSSAPNGKKYTRTICQNLLVLLSVPKEVLLSEKLRNAEQNKITLAAAPADTEKLAQAVEVGKLRLVLRNPVNHLQVYLAGADERDLLPHDALRIEPPEIGPGLLLPPPPPPSLAPRVPEAKSPPSAPLQWIVDVFKGSNKESHAFPEQ